MNAPQEINPRIATIADIEALERVPLEQRIASWNVNELIRMGCERDPGKAAIHYVEDGDPASPCRTLTYGQLQQQARQALFSRGLKVYQLVMMGPRDDEAAWQNFLASVRLPE